MLKTPAHKKLEKLLDSIIQHDLEAVKKLIRKGVDVNGYEDQAKLRPLHFAVQHHFLPAIKALITAGADPSAETSEGETPLDIAKLYQYEDLISFFRDKTSQK